MQLHYRQHSAEGEPLIILHGLFGSAQNWNWHARKWAHDYAVYALDMRNHGQSLHSDSMTYADMAEDIAAFMTRHELAQAMVLGHSMGGKAAMQLALDHPQRVRALVVADIAPVAYDGEHDGIFEGLCAIDVQQIRSRADADAVLAEHVEDELVRQFLLANLERDGDAFRWRINLPVLQRSYDALREAPCSDGQYAGPTLFIRGDKSAYVQDSHREAIMQLFPQAELKTLMQAGHWLHAEKPDSFNRLVSEFLARHAGSQVS